MLIPLLASAVLLFMEFAPLIIGCYLASVKQGCAKKTFNFTNKKFLTADVKDERDNRKVIPLQMFSQRNNPYCDLL